MRNWNITVRTSEGMDLWGIQPTYEELKPDQQQHGRDYWYRIQPTYEELKLQQGTWSHAKNIRYPAYLWGIETFFESAEIDKYNRYPAYLWGIETSLPVRCPRRKWSVSSLPMRNWNDARIAQIQAEIASIQPTYEELKPTSSRMKPSSLGTCIQPTYEELKLFRYWRPSWRRPCGIQPTYEELKRPVNLVVSPTVLVSSLPMRNWNLHSQIGKNDR